MKNQSSTMQGQKELSQHVEDLRAIMALQEQGKKFFTQWCEEKLNHNRKQILHLQEVMREDTQALDAVQKVERALSCPQHRKRAITKVCGTWEHLAMALTSRTAEVAQEELRADIYAQVKMCNLLLDQVRQRCRARDALQRWLQQLRDAEMDDNQHQVQMIHQVENDIENMLMKGKAGEKVTTLYLGVWHVLRKDLAHLPSYLDLLCEMTKLYHRELQDMESMASDTLRTTQRTKEDLAKVQAQYLKERAFRLRSLASEKVPIDRHWLKEVRERVTHSSYDLFADILHDPLEDADSEAAKAAKTQMEHDIWLTGEVEKAKAVVQCSCLWDIPSRITAQQKSTVKMQQFIKECKEKKQELKKTLKELEMKLAEMMFHQPLITTRKLQEEVRMNLQREEARLEQLQAQMLMNQELLLEFENGINHLTARLRGITLPDQDDSAKAMAVEEKLQYCQQKLQYLLHRVADVAPPPHSLEEDNETFAKVRNLLEKAMTKDTQHLKISEEVDSSIQELFADRNRCFVPTREYIKKQGLQLIERKESAKK